MRQPTFEGIPFEQCSADVLRAVISGVGVEGALQDGDLPGAMEIDRAIAARLLQDKS